MRSYRPALPSARPVKTADMGSYAPSRQSALSQQDAVKSDVFQRIGAWSGAGEKQVDVVGGDVERAAGLRVEQPRRQRALAPLQLQHLLLDGRERHQAVNEHGLLLANAVAAV